MNLFESNIESWKRVYLYDGKIPVNRGMAFGRKMADGLENDEITGDAVLDLVMEQIPKFEIMDKIVEDKNGISIEIKDYNDGKIKEYLLPVLKNGKQFEVPLLAKPDTMKKDLSAFKEYKTGQEPWTRKKVDEFGQITFYATVMFIISGKIPHDIELVHISTQKEVKGCVDSKIEATGMIYRYKTTRNMSQILNMMVRMKKAWISIGQVTEEALM